MCVCVCVRVSVSQEDTKDSFHSGRQRWVGCIVRMISKVLCNSDQGCVREIQIDWYGRLYLKGPYITWLPGQVGKYPEHIQLD